MDPFTIVGGLLSAVGMFGSSRASKRQAQAQQAAMAAQAAAQRQVVQLQQQQEKIRREQMNMEARQQQRALIRQAQAARALSTNRAAASGGLRSSGLAGAVASIYGQQGVQSTSIFANQVAGNRMFDINDQITQVNLSAAQTIGGFNQQAASYGTRASTFAGIGQLGQSIVNNAGTANNVYQSLFGTTTGWQTTVNRA